MSLPELFIKKDGEQEFAVTSIAGLHYAGITLSSPQPVTNYQTSVGLDGETQSGDITFGPRTATASFYMETDGDYDFELACQLVWQKLFSRKIMRIRDDKTPYLVLDVYVKAFDITRVSFYDMTFSVEFDVPSGFRRSIATSHNLADNIEFGMDLKAGETLSYEYKDSNFKVFNPSDVEIQAYEKGHNLDIIITGSGSPTLTNNTTGQTFKFNKQIVSGDTLLIHNDTVTLNNQPCERDTNHESIDLAQGYNDITLSGLSGAKCIFDFPFIYF